MSVSVDFLYTNKNYFYDEVCCMDFISDYQIFHKLEAHVFCSHKAGTIC